MSKRALITGITGQDGAYLSHLLLQKGYQVYGAHRRSATLNLWRVNELGVLKDIHLVPLELLELSNIIHTIEKIQPDEIYNLAAQSHVAVSFEQPIYTAEVDGLGVSRLLEAIRCTNPKIRFYQASSSEMFGKVQQTPQTEKTPFYPRSPYSVAKAFGHYLTVNYRESYGMHAASGILFNHESPLRGIDFVTRKITAGLANVKKGYVEKIELGNLDSQRDWGYAGDYVYGMWLMLQAKKAGDYVLATNNTHTVREFIEIAAKALGFDLQWEGKGVDEKGIDALSGKTIIAINPSFYRPAEVDLLLGDYSKAQKELGWNPKVSFEKLVTMMVEKDLARAEKSQVLA